MTFLDDRASTRVVDGHVGWEADETAGMAALDSPTGLRLASGSPIACGTDAQWLDGCLPDRLLAPTGDGGWLHVHDGDLTRLAPCSPNDAAFEIVNPCPVADTRVAAVAGGPLGVALLGRERPSVSILDGVTLRVRRKLSIPWLLGVPRVVAWVSRRLLVISSVEAVLIGLDGRVLSRYQAGVLATAERSGLVRVSGGRPEPVVAVSVVAGWYQLYRVGRDGISCVPLDPDQITCCGTVGSITWPDGFCVPVGEQRRCFTNEGRPGHESGPPPSSHRYATAGHVATLALDGGRDDTTWSRIRIEADRPAGTTVLVRGATSTRSDAAPAHGEWRELAPGSTDARLRLPPGRYLRLRIELAGDGSSTPTLHRIRVDLNPPGTLDLLPAVYRREPTSADFTRRFLALFDAELEAVDATIERAPRMLDPRVLGGVGDVDAAGFYSDPSVGGETTTGAKDDEGEREALAALAALIGVNLDRSWPLSRARQLLRRPDLLALRGSPIGLSNVVRLLFDTPVHIEELSQRRTWGALGQARLREARLYSRAGLAVRLGSSVLGKTPIDATAAPEQSAHSSGAFQTIVHVAGTNLDADARAGLTRTVNGFTPAHVKALVRFAGDTTLLGNSLLVGIDSRIGAAPVVTLRHAASGQSPRLGSAALSPGRGVTVTVGRRSQVGLDTTVG